MALTIFHLSWFNDCQKVHHRLKKDEGKKTVADHQKELRSNEKKVQAGCRIEKHFICWRRRMKTGFTRRGQQHKQKII